MDEDTGEPQKVTFLNKLFRRKSKTSRQQPKPVSPQASKAPNPSSHLTIVTAIHIETESVIIHDDHQSSELLTPTDKSTSPHQISPKRVSWSLPEDKKRPDIFKLPFEDFFSREPTLYDVFKYCELKEHGFNNKQAVELNFILSGYYHQGDMTNAYQHYIDLAWQKIQEIFPDIEFPDDSFNSEQLLEFYLRMTRVCSKAGMKHAQKYFSTCVAELMSASSCEFK